METSEHDRFGIDEAVQNGFEDFGRLSANVIEGNFTKPPVSHCSGCFVVKNIEEVLEMEQTKISWSFRRSFVDWILSPISFRR